MTITRTQFFSFPIEDRSGQIAAILMKLRAEGVDMEALWSFGIGSGRGQVIAVPKDADLFRERAGKAGWIMEEGTCFRIKGADRSGVLVEPLNKIAAAGINLHAFDSVAVGDSFGCYLWAEPKDVEQLGKILDA